MPPESDLNNLPTQAKQRQQDNIKTILLINHTFYSTSEEMKTQLFSMLLYVQNNESYRAQTNHENTLVIKLYEATTQMLFGEVLWWLYWKELPYSILGFNFIVPILKPLTHTETLGHTGRCDRGRKAASVQTDWSCTLFKLVTAKPDLMKS